MKPLTINELKAELETLIEKGYGEHLAFVSDDEECNGFHELYGGFSLGGGMFEYLNHHTHKMEKARFINLE